MISQSFLIATLLYTAQSAGDTSDTQIEQEAGWSKFMDHDMSCNAAVEGLCQTVTNTASDLAFRFRAVKTAIKETYHQCTRATNTAPKCRVSIKEIRQIKRYGKFEETRRPYICYEDGEDSPFEWTNIEVSDQMFNFKAAKNLGAFSPMKSRYDEYCHFHIYGMNPDGAPRRANLKIDYHSIVGMPAYLIQRVPKQQDHIQNSVGIEFITDKSFRFGYYGRRNKFHGYEIELDHENITEEDHKLLIDYFANFVFPEWGYHANRYEWKVKNNDRIDNSNIPLSYFEFLEQLAKGYLRSQTQLNMFREWLDGERKRLNL